MTGITGGCCYVDFEFSNYHEKPAVCSFCFVWNNRPPKSA